MLNSGLKIPYVANGLRGLRKLYKGVEPYNKLEEKHAQRELFAGKGWEEPPASEDFEKHSPRKRHTSVDDKLLVFSRSAAGAKSSQEPARLGKRGWGLCSASRPGAPLPLRGRSCSSRGSPPETAASSEQRWSSPSPRTERPSCFPCRTPRRGRSAYQAAAERQRSHRLGGRASGEQPRGVAVTGDCKALKDVSLEAESESHGAQNCEEGAEDTELSMAEAPAPQEVPSPNLLVQCISAESQDPSQQHTPGSHAAEQAHEGTSEHLPSKSDESARVRHASAHAELGSGAWGCRQLIDTPSSRDSRGCSWAVTPLDSLTFSPSPSQLTPLNSLAWAQWPQPVASTTTPASGEARLQEAQLLLAEMLSCPIGAQRNVKGKHQRPMSAPPTPCMQRIPENAQAQLEHCTEPAETQTRPLRPINGAMPWFPTADLSEPSNSEKRFCSNDTRQNAQNCGRSMALSNGFEYLRADFGNGVSCSSSSNLLMQDDPESVPKSNLQTILSGLPLLAVGYQYHATDLTETVVQVQAPSHECISATSGPASDGETVMALSPLPVPKEQSHEENVAETIVRLPSAGYASAGAEPSDTEFCELLQARLGEPPTPSPRSECTPCGEEACREDHEFCQLLAGRLNSPVMLLKASPAAYQEACAPVTTESGLVSEPLKVTLPWPSRSEVPDLAPRISSTDACRRARRILDAAKAVPASASCMSSNTSKRDAFQGSKALEMLMTLREARKPEMLRAEPGTELSATSDEGSVKRDKHLEKDSNDSVRDVPKRRLLSDFHQVMAERRALYKG